MVVEYPANYVLSISNAHKFNDYLALQKVQAIRYMHVKLGYDDTSHLCQFVSILGLLIEIPMHSLSNTSHHASQIRRR